MNIRNRFPVLLLLLIAVFLAGCSDRCTDQNKPAEVEKYKRIMRQFDDQSVLAQSTPKEQLAVVVLELQNTRRQAEDLDTPECLKPLQSAQVNFMNAVLTTMTNFLGGKSGGTIQAQILASRELRTQYEAELAKQLGQVYVTPTAYPTSTTTPVTVKADQDVALKQDPTKGQAVGQLKAGQSANATGRLDGNEWVQVELRAVPGVKVWVESKQVTLNGDINSLPVIKP